MTAQDTDEPQNNFEHLSSHLKEGSVAARLVAAYVAAPTGGGEAALQSLVKQRIQELAKTYDDSDHPKD